MADEPAGPEPEEPPPEPATIPKPPPPVWRRVRRYVLVALVSPFVALFLYTLIMLNWAYSSGERSGTVSSFGRQGWFCKTWEGELVAAAAPGVLPERWAFTVRDDDVARQVADARGQRVVLYYSEHRGLWSSCFGETPYFVDSVRVLEEGR
jgi:hypothetical protein